MRTLPRTALALGVALGAISAGRLSAAAEHATAASPQTRRAELAETRAQFVRHLAKRAAEATDARNHPALELLLRKQGVEKQHDALPWIELTPFRAGLHAAIGERVKDDPYAARARALRGLVKPLVVLADGSLRMADELGMHVTPPEGLARRLGVETGGKLVQTLNRRLLRAAGVRGAPMDVDAIARAIDALDRRLTARPAPQGKAWMGTTWDTWETDVETIFPHAQLLFAIHALTQSATAPDGGMMPLGAIPAKYGVDQLVLERHGSTRRLSVRHLSSEPGYTGHAWVSTPEQMSKFGLGTQEALRELLEDQMLRLAPEDYE